MLLLLGFIFVIIVIGIVAGLVASSLRSSDQVFESWTDRMIIDQAKTIDVFDSRNEKKIKKLISRLAPIASRNEEAREVRDELKRALEEKFADE